MRLSLILFLLIVISKVFAQNTIGNEWINFDKQYLKIEINKDGIYKLSHKELSEAGLKSFKNLTLFHHGKMVTINVQGEVNQELKPDGYIEFYAEKNYGDLDSLVYRPVSARTNPYQSLFSDVSAYFLVSADALPKRLDTYLPQKTLASEEIKYFTEETVFAPNTQYSYNNSIGLLPNLQQSFYEPGEGWSGNFIDADTLGKFSITLDKVVLGKKVNLEIQLNGRSREFHSLNVTLNAKKLADDLNFAPFDIFKKNFVLDSLNNSKLDFVFSSNKKTQYDWYSLTYLKANYQRLIAEMGPLPKKIFLENINTENFNFSILNSKINTRVFDISDKYNVRELLKNTNSSGLYEQKNSLKKHTIYIVENLLSPIKLSLLKFEQPQKEVDFLIITHHSLLTSAKEYATYRASTAGGNYKTAIVNIDEAYNQYFYGEKNPDVVKRIASEVLKNSNRRFLLLLGRPVTFPEILKTNTTDLVPSYGYPGSDVLLTAGLFGQDSDVQGVPTGRLNVTQNQEVINYLDKLKDFEKQTSGDEWRKKILHLSGGENANEITSLKQILLEIAPLANEGYLGAEISTKVKKTDDETEEIDISKEINEGVSMLTFVGHGSPNIIDLNIGYSSNIQRNYSNKSKYPLMFFNGCGVGNIFYRYNPLSTDWLLTPNKGSIAVLANSFWSYLYPTQQYLDVLYDKLFIDNSSVNLGIGEIQQAVNIQLSKLKKDPYVLANMHQMILQGDPALKIFVVSKPDYLVAQNGIFLLSKNGIEKIGQSDSLKVGLLIKNFGRFDGQQVIEGNIKTEGSKTTETKFNFKGFGLKDTLFVNIKRDNSIRKITVNLDPSNKISELTEDNNSQILSIASDQQWAEIGQNTLYPEGIIPDELNPVMTVLFDGKNIENKEIVQAKVSIEITLVDERPLLIQNRELINVFIKKCDTCAFKLLSENDFTLSQTQKNNLILKLKAKEFGAGFYTILVQAKDMANNKPGVAYQKTFEVLPQSLPTIFTVYPNPSESFVQLNIKIFDVVNPKSLVVEVFNSLGKRLYFNLLDAKVGNNSVYFPLAENYGSGIYVIKVKLLKQNNEIEVFQSKTVIR
jgi:Peptidase family C25